MDSGGRDRRGERLGEFDFGWIAMRIPTRLQELLPPEAANRLMELVNQPSLVSGLREAAKSLGWREAWQPSQLGDALHQARHWVEMLQQRWQPLSPQVLSGLNATGEVFGSRWAGFPLDSRAIKATAMVAGGFVCEEDLRSVVAARIATLAGADDALVVGSLPQAIRLLTELDAGHRQWILPRVDQVRLPGGGDVLELLTVHGQSVISLGASNACAAEDWASIGRVGPPVGVLTVRPCGLLAKTQAEEHAAAAVELAHRRSGVAVEVAIDGLWYPVPQWPWQPGVVRDSIAAGCDVVVLAGDGLVGGPRCGIVVGGRSWIERLRATATRLGLLANPLTLAALWGVLDSSPDVEAWKRTPLGATLTNNPENLKHRGDRLATLLRAQPVVEQVEVLERTFPLSDRGPFSNLHLPSAVLKVKTHGAEASEVARRLARGATPLWLRVEQDALWLVMRTLDPADDTLVAEAFGAETAEVGSAVAQGHSDE
jgi:L-seryl-tRNA(Ser) seleniumtransferase